MATSSWAQDYLVMVHSNPVSLSGGVVRVDRKFHLGMLHYAKRIRLPCVTVNPEARPGESVMDAIEVPVAGLPYRVEPIATTDHNAPTRAARRRLQEIIQPARLVYGSGASYRISKEFGVPFVSLQEYDLKTQLSVAVNQSTGAARRVIRAARCTLNFYKDVIPEVAGADAIHCNGFPFYEFALRYNKNALLYLDSRMSADMVMSDSDLESRLGTLGSRRLRLLFSGRYERIKGADQAVQVAVECIRQGLNIELHCYGQGSLKETMRQIAAQARSPDRIFIHDAIPYPELVVVSRTFDVFVCCHIQNDPSCTYLESMGAGLPVVGYANRMWQRLCEVSNSGYYSAIGQPRDVASDIGRLLSSRSDLMAMSRRALQFAREHCFEIEFGKRVDSLNVMLESPGSRERLRS